MIQQGRAGRFDIIILGVAHEADPGFGLRFARGFGGVSVVAFSAGGFRFLGGFTGWGATSTVMGSGADSI